MWTLGLYLAGRDYNYYFCCYLKSGLAGIALIILIGLAGIALIILIPLWLLTVVLKFLVNTINWIIGKPKTENQGGVEQVKTRSWLKQAAVIGVDLNIQQWRKNSAEEKKMIAMLTAQNQKTDSSSILLLKI